jgi:hypothetical protein
MIDFAVWLLAQTPDYYHAPDTYITVDVTEQRIEAYLRFLSVTKAWVYSNFGNIAVDMAAILGRRQVVYYFPEGGGPTVYFMSGEDKDDPTTVFGTVSLLKVRQVPIVVSSVADLLPLAKRNQYLKVLFQGNYYVWGISGFVISEVFFLDLLYKERMHSLALNPELPPLGINITDYVTNNGPLFPNKESKDLAVALVTSVGVSATFGLALAYIAYALTFVR